MDFQTWFLHVLAFCFKRIFSGGFCFRLFPKHPQTSNTWFSTCLFEGFEAFSKVVLGDQGLGRRPICWTSEEKGHHLHDHQDQTWWASKVPQFQNVLPRNCLKKCSVKKNVKWLQLISRCEEVVFWISEMFIWISGILGFTLTFPWNRVQIVPVSFPLCRRLWWPCAAVLKLLPRHLRRARAQLRTNMVYPSIHQYPWISGIR